MVADKIKKLSKRNLATSICVYYKGILRVEVNGWSLEFRQGLITHRVIKWWREHIHNV